MPACSIAVRRMLASRSARDLGLAGLPDDGAAFWPYHRRPWPERSIAQLKPNNIGLPTRISQ